ncbi:MAG TPA: tetratricopeptide repeat protein [Sedimentisphaerales bacterium]|nr:tetratricopeptide repeat protein [Sedimentisphaerales bacterium]
MGHKTIPSSHQVLSDAAGRTRRWRPYLFRFAAVTFVPLVLLVTLELALRAFGFGYPPGAIIKSRMNGRKVYARNIRFGWRFFPANISRECDPFVLPVKKAGNSFRVFVLGASAAAGEPETGYSFGRMLERMLERRYPQLKIELVTLAMAAINSHAVLEIAADCAAHEPDLFVVYLGNNEVIGPYGPGTVFSPFLHNLTLIRAGIAVKATRVGQLITSIADNLTAGSGRPKRWGGLEMFLDRQVPADSPALEPVYKHFERNLRDICRIASRAGAEVILCTVGSNLRDNPPFASQHDSGLSDKDRSDWQKLYDEALCLEQDGRFTEAVGRYHAALDVDDAFAECHYRLANCYVQTGSYEKARDGYVRARDLDTLRFRADSRINHIIRSVAAETAASGTILADAAQVFERNSPHWMPGSELFLEHVHLNFHGNFILARTVLEAAEKILARGNPAFTAQGSVLSEQDCAELLAFSKWDHYRLIRYVFEEFIQTGPFARQAYHEHTVEQFRGEIAALEASCTQPEALKQAAAAYKKALSLDPSDAKLRFMYARFLALGVGDKAGAIEQLREAIKLLPDDFRSYNMLGELLCEPGKRHEAVESFQRCLEIKPTCASANLNLGQTLARSGDLKPAVSHLRRVITLDARLSAGAYGDLAIALDKLDHRQEAISVVSEGIAVFPRTANLHFLRAALLAADDRLEEAICEVQSCLALEPGHKEAAEFLKVLRQERR